MEGGNLAVLDPIDPIGYPIDTHTIKSWKKFNLQTEKESVALLGAHTLGRAMTSMSGFQVLFFHVDIFIVKIVRKMSTLCTLHRVFITPGCQ